MSFDIVDGFTYSTTLRLLQTQYRAHAFAQIENLRRAGAYKARYYTAPDTLSEPIAAYGQVETQIRAVPGTYIWGISFFSTTETPDSLRIQVVDTSTEVRLFIDYIRAIMLQQGANQRCPTLLGQPRLITEPGQVNVELYNDNPVPVAAQLVLYCAEPVEKNRDIGEGNHISVHRRLT